MAEIISPTAPVAPPPGPTLQVSSLLLDWDNQNIIIKLRAADGSILSFGYGAGDGALTMMIALNKANLSLQSLHRRIMNRLIADGKISGTISGTPD